MKYSQQKIFLIVIKAKTLNILKKATSDALIFSMHVFLQKIKYSRLSSPESLGTQPTGQGSNFAEEKATTWASLKGDEVMLNEMQHLLCKIKNEVVLQLFRKVRKHQKPCLGLNLQVSWTFAKFLSAPLEIRSVKNKPPCYYRIYIVPKKLKVSDNMIKSPSIKSTARYII